MISGFEGVGWWGWVGCGWCLWGGEGEGGGDVEGCLWSEEGGGWVRGKGKGMGLLSFCGFYICGEGMGGRCGGFVG